MDIEIVEAARTLESKVKTLAENAGQNSDLFALWDNDDPFINPEDHLVSAVRTSAPSAGELDEGAVAMGDGTGPNGRDEIFWSVDGQTVARVEADSTIV